jgi:hypothetical protein
MVHSSWIVISSPPDPTSRIAFSWPVGGKCQSSCGRVHGPMIQQPWHRHGNGLGYSNTRKAAEFGDRNSNNNIIIRVGSLRRAAFCSFDESCSDALGGRAYNSTSHRTNSVSRRRGGGECAWNIMATWAASLLGNNVCPALVMPASRSIFNRSRLWMREPLSPPQRNFFFLLSNMFSTQQLSKAFFPCAGGCDFVWVYC